MPNDYWELLRTGKLDEGLHRMREAFLGESGTSEAMELGVAYLWTERYAAAWDHFYHVIQDHPLDASCIYGMAGAAKWCLDEPEYAVYWWREGLGCEFADAAGAGFTLPLLLYFASVVKPDLLPRSEAEELLVEKARDPRIRVWTGPAIKYLLGYIDEQQLLAEAIDPNEIETPLNQWHSDFYIGVAELARGESTEYRRRMQRAAMVEWSDYDVDKDLFLSKLWQEEYFLARHESKSAARGVIGLTQKNEAGGRTGKGSGKEDGRIFLNRARRWWVLFPGRQSSKCPPVPFRPRARVTSPPKVGKLFRPKCGGAAVWPSSC